MSNQEESKQRLLGVLPHLKVAIHMAQTAEPEGTVFLAVIGKKPDGSGTVICSFEGEQFLADVATVCDVADKPGWADEVEEAEEEEKPE